MCVDGDAAKCAQYGKLYSWFQVMNGQGASNAKPSGVQGICPKGWHVPSTPEWTQLITSLGGVNIAGAALKNKYGWNLSSPPTDNTNISGFSALPAGFTVFKSSSGVGFKASFHTASESHSGGYIDLLQLSYDNSAAIWNIEPLLSGPPDPTKEISYSSCRCLKD